MRRFCALRALVPATVLMISLPSLAAGKTADLDARPHIDMVFAIDCSGSMGGVINTAKQKIWSIVNEIAKAKPSPVLRIGLHGYGNAERSFRNFPLSDDLDQVYADLMTFKDEGWGSEYVGLSVRKTTLEMDWKDWEKSGASNVLRVLYVVGNETAEQGPVSYKITAPEALKKQIYVNAIYCGESGGMSAVPSSFIQNSANRAGNAAPVKVPVSAGPSNHAPAKSGSRASAPLQAQQAMNMSCIALPVTSSAKSKPAPKGVQPINSSALRLTQVPKTFVIPPSTEVETWREMAQLGGGEFSQIAASGGGVTIPTPYDSEFVTLNTKLNGTYLAYGATGKDFAANQMRQDLNSVAVGGASNLAARAQAKSSVQYNSRRWDLVDAIKEKDFDLKKIAKEDLPAEIQKLSPDEQKKYIDKKAAERAALQKQIGELGRKREEFVQAELKKKNMSLDQALDEQILRSIRQQATKRGFKF